jgi:hypothetical protein
MAERKDRGGKKIGGDISGVGSGGDAVDPTTAFQAVPLPVPGRIEKEARLQAGKHRDVQVARTGGRKLFGEERRGVFLEWFAATANVSLSAEQAMTELARPRGEPRIRFL